jgi:hypothetical protein
VLVKNGTYSTVDIGTNLYPGPTCQTFLGSITLTAAYANNATPYVAPAFQTWLSQLGVGSLQSIGGSLTVNADHWPFGIPVTLSPTFLPTLLSAGTIIVNECANCRANPNVAPNNPALAALPGLKNLQTLSGVLPGGSLTIQNSRFADLASFAGLQCSTGLLSLNSNPFLISLQTLTTLKPWTVNAQGPQLLISNPLLVTGPQLAPLQIVSGCSGTTSSFNGPISVQANPKNTCTMTVSCPTCTLFVQLREQLCVCACVRARVCVCVCVCARERARACVCVSRKVTLA